MFKGFYNLTSGMITQGKNLDVIANNMTNAATAGFKVDKFTYSTFQDVMWERVGNADRNYTELGNQSWITAPSRLYTDYSQGAIEETGQPLDFAIEGDGFFALETDEGRVYTRNGNFSLDDEGYLWLSGFGRVLDPDGNTIRLVTDQITADETGSLFTENGGLLGQLGVFRFEDNGALEKNDREAMAKIFHPAIVEAYDGDIDAVISDLDEHETQYGMKLSGWETIDSEAVDADGVAELNEALPIGIENAEVHLIELTGESGSVVDVYLLLVQTAEGWSLYYSY